MAITELVVCEAYYPDRVDPNRQYPVIHGVRRRDPELDSSYDLGVDFPIIEGRSYYLVHTVFGKDEMYGFTKSVGLYQNKDIALENCRRLIQHNRTYRPNYGRNRVVNLLLDDGNEYQYTIRDWGSNMDNSLESVRCKEVTIDSFEKIFTP